MKFGRGIPLTVVGEDAAACASVWAEVEWRIARMAGKAQRMEAMMIVFHEVGRNQKAILTSAPVRRKGPYIHVRNTNLTDRQVQMYQLLRIEDKGLDDLMGRMELVASKEKYDWEEFSEAALTNILDKSLKMAKDERQAKTVEFNISPGKLTFRGQNSNDIAQFGNLSLAPDSEGIIWDDQIAMAGLRPMFQPLLAPSVFEEITRNLQTEGFVCLNPKDPERFTTVHLQAGVKRVYFCVTMALDENLEELTPEADSRLDDEKKTAIEKVFRATTIGEVLDTNTNYKIAFRKLSLLVQPDKNSHPGATEAFKKVQNAYEEFKAGCFSGHSALKIEQPETIKLSPPPKVVSVKTNKKKISNITFFSSAPLDLRASVTVFEEDAEQLTEHVREVLASSWERRDEQGGIATTGRETGLFIHMIKQVK